MASEKSIAKLFKSSANASQSQVQHIVLTVNADGKVLAAGSHNMIAAFVGNPNVFEHVKTTMRSSCSQEPILHANTHQLDYPPLPFPPSSPKWNGVVRGVLTKMLVTAGYGRHKLKLGEGIPPVGWPVNIDWSEFIGSTRSKLWHGDITLIVTSMLEAAGYDPNNHIEAPAPEEEEDIVEEEAVVEDMNEG
jgi:hypothetical protein